MRKRFLILDEEGTVIGRASVAHPRMVRGNGARQVESTPAAERAVREARRRGRRAKIAVEKADEVSHRKHAKVRVEDIEDVEDGPDTIEEFNILTGERTKRRRRDANEGVATDRGLPGAPHREP